LCGKGSTVPQPGDDVGDDLRTFGLVVELMAEPRVRASFHVWQGRESFRCGGRDQAVVEAMEDQRRRTKTPELASHPRLFGQRLGPEPCRARRLARRIGCDSCRDPRVAGERPPVDAVGDGKGRHDPREERGQDLLPARKRRIEPWRREDDKVRLLALRQQVAEHDQATHRVAVQDDRSAGCAAPDRDQSFLEVVVVLRPAVDMPSPTSRPPLSPEIEAMDVQPGGSHLIANVFVPAAVFTQPVDDQHRSPWRVRGPVPDEQLQPIGRGSTGDEGCQVVSVSERLVPDSPVAATIAVMSSWVELGDRVFVRRYEFYDQNIGVVLGDGEVLLIDTRSTHVQARELQADLRMLTADPVTVVVDTHGHFDHVFGNHVFRPATIWGQAGCPPFMARTGEQRRARIKAQEPSLAADLDEVVIDPPDRVFDETARIEVGDRPVDLRYLGRAHTDHDIVIVVPDADVIFAGDLIEGGNVPFFNDGFALDWPETAFRLADLVHGTVVPGHGDVAGHAFALEQAVAFQALAELGRRIHGGDLDLEAALELTPYPDLPREDIRAPLERALAQLRGELT
jgi:glyoxylase-like metal-dependent hydrolase (beta-lactamase superfamily II)